MLFSAFVDVQQSTIFVATESIQCAYGELQNSSECDMDIDWT